MTKEEAKNQVENFFRKLGEEVSVFGETNYAKAEIGTSSLVFEYTDKETLACVALIHKFDEAPKKEILKAIEDAAENEIDDSIHYDEFTKSLFLERIYDETLDDEDFYTEMRNLSDWSLVWRKDFINSDLENSQSA
jgi:hypothetical protein